ncbi:hypothetical protein N7507_001655 [Penicillium longicatenatum]|nr:hypothetical protein N7507_001655 [Penicillium longicatenatum]
MDELLEIITNTTPLDGLNCAPDRPLHLFDHARHPLSRPNYPFDHMIEGSHVSKPRLPVVPLVSKNFRKEWIEVIKEENRLIVEQKAMEAEGQESLTFIQQGREHQGTGEEFDDSEIFRGQRSQELQSQETAEQSGYQSDEQILQELQTEPSAISIFAPCYEPAHVGN